MYSIDFFLTWKKEAVNAWHRHPTSSTHKTNFVEGVAERSERCVFSTSNKVLEINNKIKGGGGGSVGTAVASDSRGPRFESSHRQKFINIEHLYAVNCVLKRRK